MGEPDLFRRIRDELKRTVRLLLDQLRREHPTERLYAVLFEVDVSETYVIRIAASEESLTREAERYAAKGYKVRSGDLLETLRAMSRWDAPGDSRVGWYWGNQDDDLPVTQLIDQAVKSGLILEYDETQPLRRLCVEALRELDGEGAFGSGAEREPVLIGTTCVEVGFCELEEDISELATLNPPATITRLRRELEAEVVASGLLVRPWERGER
jgi:hypothetical protein